MHFDATVLQDRKNTRNEAAGILPKRPSGKTRRSGRTA